MTCWLTQFRAGCDNANVFPTAPNHSLTLPAPNHHLKARTKQLEDDLASARAMLTNALTEREACMERSSKVSGWVLFGARCSDS